MPPMTPADWHFPLRCTHCAAEAGHAFSVQTKSSTEVIVSVRCGACSHVWILKRETPALGPQAEPGIGDENIPE